MAPPSARASLQHSSARIWRGARAKYSSTWVSVIPRLVPRTVSLPTADAWGRQTREQPLDSLLQAAYSVAIEERWLEEEIDKLDAWRQAVTRYGDAEEE